MQIQFYVVKTNETKMPKAYENKGNPVDCCKTEASIINYNTNIGLSEYNG